MNSGHHSKVRLLKAFLQHRPPKKLKLKEKTQPLGLNLKTQKINSFYWQNFPGVPPKNALFINKYYQKREYFDIH